MQGDLLSARTALGLGLTDADVHALLVDADRDHSGSIDFSEFCDLLFFAHDVHTHYWSRASTFLRSHTEVVAACLQ